MESSLSNDLIMMSFTAFYDCIFWLFAALTSSVDHSVDYFDDCVDHSPGSPSSFSGLLYEFALQVRSLLVRSFSSFSCFLLPAHSSSNGMCAVGSLLCPLDFALPMWTAFGYQSFPNKFFDTPRAVPNKSRTAITADHHLKFARSSFFFKSLMRHRRARSYLARRCFWRAFLWPIILMISSSVRDPLERVGNRFIDAF